MSGEPQGGLRSATRRKLRFGQTLRSVAWSFFGVRKAADYEKDVGQLNPVHLIIAGVLCAVLFVLGLVLLVNWVLASGVAA